MTSKDFRQVAWDATTSEDCRQLIRLAAREDLSRGYDLTTLALVAADMLNLRAEPSTGADIVTCAPRGSQVTVLEPAGPAIAIGGKADRWVKIRIDACFSFIKSGFCASRAQRTPSNPSPRAGLSVCPLPSTTA